MEPSETPIPQPPEPTSNPKLAELEAWQTIAGALRILEPSAQARVLKSVSTLLEIDFGGGRETRESAHQSSTSTSGLNTSFSNSEERQLSPKEFLHQKRPGTDVDKVACLAYYLTHYRQTPHFKTIDLSQLNTEAAQIKLSNAAQSVDNATKAGLLVPAIKAHKQLSAAGELYVQELPDKAAARAAIEGYRRKRSKRAGNALKVEETEG
jgi:hypothetical protein